MSEEMEEYAKRLVPASDEEIVGLAQEMWADPTLRGVFQRVGYDGDMTEVEQAAVDAAIDAYRQGPLRDRDRLHLALAPCILRQFAMGMITRLDSPEAKAFLEDRKVKRIASGIHGINPTASEIMAFAQTLRADPLCWKIMMRVKDDLELSEEETSRLNAFQTKYKYKYGLVNRSSLNLAVALLRKLAAGKVESLESPEAWAELKKSPYLIRIER